MDTGGGWLALQKRTLSVTLVSLPVEGAEWNPASSGGKELACWPGSNQREPARRCVWGKTPAVYLKKIHWSLGILKPTVFTKTKKNNCLSTHKQSDLIRIVERKLNINKPIRTNGQFIRGKCACREQLVYSVDLAEFQKWQTIVSILSQTEVSTL